MFQMEQPCFFITAGVCSWQYHCQIGKAAIWKPLIYLFACILQFMKNFEGPDDSTLSQWLAIERIPFSVPLSGLCGNPFPLPFNNPSAFGILPTNGRLKSELVTT